MKYYLSLSLFIAFLLTCNLGITKLEASESETIKLISPANGSSYEFWDGYTNNTFSWLKYKDSKKYELEFSVDNFKNYVSQGSYYASEESDTIYAYSIVPKENTKIYWRVKTWDTEGNRIYSDVYEWEAFNYLNSLTPKLIDPQNYSILINEPSIEYSWEDLPKANTYIFELYDYETNQIVFSNELQRMSLKIENNIVIWHMTNFLQNSMMYRWRVKAYNQDQESNWSTFNLFKIEFNEDILRFKPKLISPKDSVVISSQGNEVRYDREFSWQQIPEAIKYRLQISKDNFESTIYNVGILADKFDDTCKHVLKLNQYIENQWRIIAHDSLSNLYFSKTYHLLPTDMFNDELKELFYPRENVEIIKVERDSIKFSWGYRYYSIWSEIEIHKLDSNQLYFRNTIQPDFYLDPAGYCLSTDIKNPFEDGKYSWRVRSIDYYYENLGPWSDFNYFRIVNATDVEEASMAKHLFSISRIPQRTLYELIVLMGLI
jgi:hypothetical protein